MVGTAKHETSASLARTGRDENQRQIFVGTFARCQMEGGRNCESNPTDAKTVWRVRRNFLEHEKFDEHSRHTWRSSRGTSLLRACACARVAVVGKEVAEQTFLF